MSFSRSRMSRLAAPAVAVLALAAPPAASPDPLAPVYSLGKPPVWKPFAGAFYGLDRSGERHLSGGGAYLGVYKDLLPSIVGMGVSAEAYAGGYSGLSGVDGGGARPRRAALALPEGGDRLRLRARGRVLPALAHAAAAARRDPRPRDEAPRRLAPGARELVGVRDPGPPRAAHGTDAPTSSSGATAASGRRRCSRTRASSPART